MRRIEALRQPSRHRCRHDLDAHVGFRAYGDGAAEPLQEVTLGPGDPTTDLDFSVLDVNTLRLEVVEVSGSTDVTASASLFFGIPMVRITFQW